MNLERVIYEDKNYNRIVVLSKLSDFTNQYLCVKLSFTRQKINTGNDVSALNFKTITSFKETRPFMIITEGEITDGIKQAGGAYTDYDVKLKMGDYIQFNGRKFYMLGVVVNTYAQWNLPTPFLFSPKDMAKDAKMLFSGRFTDEEIVDKINDNFQAGKYDSDMAIPLIDSNDYKEDLAVFEKAPTVAETDILIRRRVEKDSVDLKAVNNVFIDAVFKNSIEELDKIKEIDYDLFTKLQGLLANVNKAVNSKISGEKKPKKSMPKEAEVPAEIPAEVVVKKEEDDLSFLDDIDKIIDVSFLEDIDSIIN
jgi:hypothetical protein